MMRGGERREEVDAPDDHAVNGVLEIKDFTTSINFNLF